MPDFVGLGDSVEGEALIYGAWSRPPKSEGKRPVTGELRRNGWVEIDERLRVMDMIEPEPEGGFDAGDRILADTASFRCDRMSRPRKSTRRNHSGWSGRLTGNARAEIVRVRSHGHTG